MQGLAVTKDHPPRRTKARRSASVNDRPKFWHWMRARGLTQNRVCADLGICRHQLCRIVRPGGHGPGVDMRIRVWSYTGGEIGFLDWPEPPGCRVPQYVYDPALRGGQ